MACTFPKELIDAVISFHGHSCPGLAIGIRASEYALQQLSNPRLADLTCVTETDMCGVDGIQFLTKCTFGKGNLIHRDVGKAAFSFYDRTSGSAFRLLLRPDAKKDKKSSPDSAAEQKSGEERRLEMINTLMDLPLSEMFDLQTLEAMPPRRARVLDSIACMHCQEDTMESRTRRMGGETLCIPCFKKVEQKI